MKVAVIGDPDFTLGFRLVGIRDVYEVSNDEELVKAVEDVLNRNDIGVVVIRYDDLRKLPLALRREIDERVEPTFVAVGGVGAVEELRDRIRKALGVDLWK
jgi:V/A-type H+-transporting ATPase subunit F